MAWRDEILKAIRTGVSSACADIVSFTENWSGTLPAEYLLTIRVATAISALNKAQSGIGFPRKVYIEERTQDFVRKCIPVWPMLSDVRLRKRIYKRVHRKGKIDVAVTHDSNPRAPGPVPVCVIEVKGFGPSAREVHKDFVRNADFMAVAGLTGQQQMFTGFVALDPGTATHERDEARDCREVKKKYRNLLRRLNLASRVKGVKATCDTFTASDELARDGMSPMELEYLGEYQHHFVGTLVAFYRDS